MKICSRGHVDRYDAQRRCLDCHAIRENARYQTNKVDICRRERERYATDPAYALKKAASSKPSAARRAKTPEGRASRNAWSKAHPECLAAYGAIRRASRMQQQCGCCSVKELAEQHVEAKMCGGEVDHRIALNLGGHHCTKNLQVLTIAAHKEKTAIDLRKMASVRLRNRLLRTWRT
jgi:hypothetical protein